MSCDRFITAIADHALGGDLPIEAAGHLEACASCRARVAAERRRIAGIEDDLRGLLAIVPSSAFPRQVHARIEMHLDRGAPRWRLGLTVAAALIVATVIAMWPERGGSGARLEQASRATSLPEEHRFTVAAPDPAPRPVDQVGRGGAQPARPPARAIARSAPAPERTDQPDVLVPPDQAVAIARLIELVNQGALADVGLPYDVRSSAVFADLAPAPIALEPITIPDVIIENSRDGGGPAQ